MKKHHSRRELPCFRADQIRKRRRCYMVQSRSVEDSLRDNPDNSSIPATNAPCLQLSFRFQHPKGKKVLAKRMEAYGLNWDFIEKRGTHHVYDVWGFNLTRFVRDSDDMIVLVAPSTQGSSRPPQVTLANAIGLSDRMLANRAIQWQREYATKCILGFLYFHLQRKGILQKATAQLTGPNKEHMFVLRTWRKMTIEQKTRLVEIARAELEIPPMPRSWQYKDHFQGQSITESASALASMLRTVGEISRADILRLERFGERISVDSRDGRLIYSDMPISDNKPSELPIDIAPLPLPIGEAIPCPDKHAAILARLAAERIREWYWTNEGYMV